MIAPLKMGGKHWPRRSALATVDPSVGGCSYLTQFINNGDELTQGQQQRVAHPQPSKKISLFPKITAKRRNREGEKTKRS